MPAAYDTVAGLAANPGATLTALTAATGDSFVVRSFPFQSNARIDEIWRFGTAAGVLRVRSPRLHDNVQGIRLRGLAGDSTPLLGWEYDQDLYPQDTLTVEVTGGGAETDLGYLMITYDDLPGIDARLATWEQVAPRINNLVGNEVAITTNATIGQWSDTAVNATFDLLKANVDYAVLGYVSDTMVGAIGVKGPDTGNLRACGPGCTQRVETRNWYVDNTRHSGRATIPIFNAANKGSTFVSVNHNAASASINVELILAELSTS